MTTKEELEKGLEIVTAKFEDPEIKASFKRFNKSVQFVYPDLNLTYVMEIADGEVKELKKEAVPRPNVNVTIDSDTFLSIVNKETNALRAYAAGKIKFKGAMTDLLKLQKLL
jgi:putative sterol carrier protein